MNDSNEGSLKGLMEMITVVSIISVITFGSLSTYTAVRDYRKEKKEEISTQKLQETLIEKNIDMQNRMSKFFIENPHNEESVDKKIPEKVINENHYHFEVLQSILKYLGIGILGIFSLLVLNKLMAYVKKTINVNKAIKNSNKIIVDFDTNFDENKNYLAFMRKLSNQVIINSVLIENRKDKESVINLIVNNEQLKSRLNLIETSLMVN